MKTQQFLRTVTITAAILLVAGCAAQMPATPSGEPAKVDQCDLLRAVVAQDDSGFADLKIRKTTTSFVDVWVDVWKTKPVFPETDCEVWEWVWDKKRVHYACTWRKEGEVEARQTFEAYVPRIQECLGPDWVTSKLVGKTGGGTLFSKPGEDTAVSLRYFRDSGLAGSWHTSLIVGKRVRINKPE